MVKICMQKTINNWIIKVIEEVTILALLWENISASTTVHSSKDLKVAFVLFFDVQNKVLSLQQQVVSIAPPYGRILSRDRLPYPVNLYAHITRVPFHIRSGHRPDRHSATRKEEWGGRESRRATELFDWKEIRRGETSDWREMISADADWQEVKAGRTGEPRHWTGTERAR